MNSRKLHRMSDMELIDLDNTRGVHYIDMVLDPSVTFETLRKYRLENEKIRREIVTRKEEAK